MESPSRNSFVTILHNGRPTMARPKLGEIVTILHDPPPTIESAEIAEIVTILHNPEIPGPVRMIIIITPAGVRDRENDNHNHSQKGG